MNHQKPNNLKYRFATTVNVFYFILKVFFPSKMVVFSAIYDAITLSIL